MKLKQPAPTLLLLFLLSFLTSYAQDKPRTQEQLVLTTERNIVEAVIRTDTTAVSSRLASGYTYTLPDGKIITKKHYLADIAQWWRPLSIDHSDQIVTLYGQTAIVVGKAKYRWKNKKGEVEEAIEQYTDTYIRLKTNWVRVSSHASCLSGRCT